MSPAAYQTIEELGLRFFTRPHESIRREPLEVEAAWRGPEMAARSDWIHELTAAEVGEIEAALAHARRAGIALQSLRREDFPLPSLAGAIADWTRELETGRGFVLVRGLPVERWSEEEASLVYWGIGQHLGTPGEQNPQRELLGHVRDYGEKKDYVRAYRTAEHIAFHVDLSDAVGLLCLRTAKTGGASRIVSSVAIYNEILRRRPDLIDRLYEPFHLDRRDEQAPGSPPTVPVPVCRFAGGRLSTFYHSGYFRSAVRHAEVPPFTPLEQELLDLYEEIAGSTDFYLDMIFEPGDIQLISNHVTLHARTAYEDWPEPDRRRHLLRLWISLRGHDRAG